MAILNETKKSTKFKQTLFGGRKNIFTLCIASAENPKDVKLSAKENEQRTNNLLKDLDRLKLTYYPVTGKYGGPDEHSYLIANINLDVCKWLFGPEKYDQESFIFGVVDEKASTDELETKKKEQHTRINFYVYKQDNNGKFFIKDEETKIIKDDDNTEYFSIFNHKKENFKFSIPFKTFLEGIEEMSSVLEEKYGWNQKRYLSVLKERALSEGKTIKHFWLLGGELLTEEQELERLKRIGLVEQNIESLSDAKKTLREEIIRLYEL